MSISSKISNSTAECVLDWEQWNSEWHTLISELEKFTQFSSGTYFVILQQCVNPLPRNDWHLTEKDMVAYSKEIFWRGLKHVVRTIVSPGTSWVKKEGPLSAVEIQSHISLHFILIFIYVFVGGHSY